MVRGGERFQTETPTLEVSDLGYRVSDTFSLKGISLSLGRGDGLAVVGTNGAGKTTLIRLVAGLLEPSVGRIRICGTSPRSWSRASQHLGYVQQAKELPDGVSVRTYLQHQLHLRRAAPERYGELIKRARLSDFETQEVRTLSGGNQRKLHIISAVAHQPDLLVLDEPTVGLDPTAQETVLNLLQELKREGVSIVFASHHRQELVALADSVAVLHQGRQIFDASLADMLRGNETTTLNLEAFVRQETPALQDWAAKLPGITSLVEEAVPTDTGVSIKLVDPRYKQALVEIVIAANAAGLSLRSATVSTPSLADFISQLIQRGQKEYS